MLIRYYIFNLNWVFYNFYFYFSQVKPHIESKSNKKHSWQSIGRQLRVGEHMESNRDCTYNPSIILYKQANNEKSDEWFKKNNWNGNKHAITLWCLTCEHVVKSTSLHQQ